MTIELLKNIIGGNIVQEGSVHEVFRATVYPQSTDKDDVCFVENRDDVKEAIQRGAGILVFSDEQLITGIKNIALIKVEEIKKAAFLLVGNVVTEKDASFELLSEKQMTFLKMILVQKSNIAILPDDWKKSFKLILSSNKRLFVGTDEMVLQAIRKDKKGYAQKATGHIVSADSLFRSTFKIDKYIYQYKQMTPFHIDHLRSAVALCKAYELPYQIDKIVYTKHFRPLFLEGEPSIQKVMKNDKVIILSDNLDDILNARAYANDIGNWMAKTVVMVPPKTKVEGVKYPTYYRNDEDILEAVEGLSYNYLFVYTQDDTLQYKIRSQYHI